VSKKRILVVDDEVALTKMVKLNLERTGAYEVRTENQALNAMSAAHEFKPDLMLLDVMMPGKTGDEIAADIREDAVLAGVKFIFVTAIVTKDETGETGSEIGGNVFLAKPVKAKELIATIERVLAG
jgi:DNA-binding response OmpR family regulator